MTAITFSLSLACSRAPSGSKALELGENRAAVLGARIWSTSFGAAFKAYAHSVAVDPLGDVVVTGEIYDAVDFGGACGTLTSVDRSADVFAAKYSSAGVCQWARAYGDENTQLGAGVAVDAAGNIYLVGSFAGRVDFGCGPMSAAGAPLATFDIFLAKLDPGGSCLRSARFGDAASQFGRAVAVDVNAGDTAVIITGDFAGRVDFGGGWLPPLPVPDALLNIYVAKLDANLVYQQARSYGDQAIHRSTAIAVDNLHDIVLTGYSNGVLNFGGADLASYGGYDIFVAKLDPGLDHLWSDHYGDPQDQLAYSVATDSARSVVLTGAFRGSVDFRAGVPTLTSLGGNNIFLAKLSELGVAQWALQFGDAMFGHEGSSNSAAIGPQDSIFFTGPFRGTVNFGGLSLSSTSGSVDVFLAKFAQDGRHFGSERYGDQQDQYGESVAVDPTGKVVLGGSFAGTIDFGGQPLTASNGVGEPFVAAFAHACDGANCAGCCDDNVCRSPSVSSCGRDGSACFACDDFRADRCEAGQCRCGANPGPCSAGQQCVGGACVCNAQSCGPNGCCQGNACASPSFPSACGTGGAACVACNANLADRCETGQCRCGTNPACSAGQRCLGGVCVCDGVSCPSGCCQGTTCRVSDLGACGAGGISCTGTACNGSRADNCLNGTCRCGVNPACGDGQQCQGGACVCNAASCPSGCCEASLCRSGSEFTRCGTNGQACVACTGSYAACVSGQCGCTGCGTYPGSCHPCSCGESGQCGTWPSCHLCSCQEQGLCGEPPNCVPGPPGCLPRGPRP